MLLRLAQVLQLQLSFVDAVVGALARVKAAVHTALAGHSTALPDKRAAVRCTLQDTQAMAVSTLPAGAQTTGNQGWKRLS